jgi:dolichyl-phosphate beta-glucosyltransferase
VGPGSTVATLSLVIPAFNEQARLPALLEVLASSAEDAVARAGLELLETLIVDDGSTDATREMLAAAQAGDPKLRPVFDLTENRGKGAAFAAGARRAEGDYLLLVDVDLSTPLEELPKLTAAIEAGADVAIGSRAVDGAIVERGPTHRKWLGKGFNSTVRVLTGLPVRDTQCGFKLLATADAKNLVAVQLCPGFAFDVELLMRAKAAGLKIAEVPVLYLHDSRSSVRVVSASSRMLRDICGLAYRLRLRQDLGPPPSSARQRSLAGLSADDSD